MSSLKKFSVRGCDKRANNKGRALRQNSDIVVKEISQLLEKMSMTPTRAPKKRKPLGVACGRARPCHGGIRRKFFINVNKKKDTRFYCSSLSYSRSKMGDYHSPNKKTFPPIRRKPSLATQGIGPSASSRASTSFPESKQSADQAQGLNFQGSEQSPICMVQSSESILFDMAREKAFTTDVPQSMSTPKVDFEPKGLSCEQKGLSSSASDTRHHSRRGQSSRRTNLEFTSYLDKRVIAKIPGSRWVEGTLRGYDTYMNLVLEDTVELRGTGERVHIGVAVIRGRSIAMVEEAGRDLSPDIIRRSYYFHEKKPLKTIQLDD